VAESRVPSIHSAHLSRFRRSREDISSKDATFSDPAFIAEVSCRPVRRESSIGLHNSAASVPVLVITTGRRRDTPSRSAAFDLLLWLFEFRLVTWLGLRLAELAESKIDFGVVGELGLRMKEFEPMKTGSWIGEKG
jgi:hypothetical protein